MKIAIIGSTAYQEKMKKHRDALIRLGHDVLIPAFDNIEGNELDICTHNRNIIKKADEVHVLWDQRSIGTVFDLGMVFMAKKPLKIIYLQPKTLTKFIKLYEFHSNRRPL